MIKNKTYRNVLILTKRIQKKGYTFEESNEMAINCFNEYNPYGIGVETIADKIINKEEWENEYKGIKNETRIV